MKEVYFFKLVTGDEFLAESVKYDEDTGSFLLKDPIVFQPVPDQNGNSRIAFVPMLYLADPESHPTFNVREDDIIYYYPPRKEIIDQYVKATSKIEVAQSVPQNLQEISQNLDNFFKNK